MRTMRMKVQRGQPGGVTLSSHDHFAVRKVPQPPGLVITARGENGLFRVEGRAGNGVQMSLVGLFDLERLKRGGVEFHIQERVGAWIVGRKHGVFAHTSRGLALGWGIIWHRRVLNQSDLLLQSFDTGLQSVSLQSDQHFLLYRRLMTELQFLDGRLIRTHMVSQTLDVIDELFFLLYHALVVHAVEVAFASKLVPRCLCSVCHFGRLFYLFPQLTCLLVEVFIAQI
mmetsp:Transcript_39946/g.69164  ORF Transcript_39946/g.69164 Transcript_39946/m.69164 type:complete len:227 (-) Transcript_39946:373-1053(-)